MIRAAERRGGVYLLVLVTSAVSMSIGVLAVTTAAAERESQELEIERHRAVIRAESGIHIALAELSTVSDWRKLVNGRAIGPLIMSRGEIAADVSEIDGDLADDADKTFTVTATASYGRAKQRVAADFEIRVEAVEALEYALVAQGGITSTARLDLEFGSVTVSSRIPLVNELMPWSDAKAMNDIGMPDVSVVKAYAALGTVINPRLSKDSRGREYDELQLTVSGALTDVGSQAGDPRAIYVIDGGGGPVRLTEPAIVGTLVVINASSLELDTVRTLRTASEGLPVLLTDVPLTINAASAAETQDRVADDDDQAEGPDFDDSTFDGIQGIIYADNRVLLSGGLDMHGTLISTERIVMADRVSIQRNEAFLQEPPSGFREGVGLRHVAGSWRQIVN